MTAKRTAESILAWHVLGPDRRLSHRHGRRRPKVYPGETLKAPLGPIQLCVNGLHASVDLEDAIRLGISAIREGRQILRPVFTADTFRVLYICRVRVRGSVQHDPFKGGRKLAGRYRRCLWMVRVSRRFASMVTNPRQLRGLPRVGPRI